jgi:hypothetical protein
MTSGLVWYQARRATDLDVALRRLVIALNLDLGCIDRRHASIRIPDLTLTLLLWFPPLVAVAELIEVRPKIAIVVERIDGRTRIRIPHARRRCGLPGWRVPPRWLRGKHTHATGATLTLTHATPKNPGRRRSK